jgi:hypothetical protein
MQEANMNTNKPGLPSEAKPDDLIRSNTIELNEDELGSVSGGIKIGSKAETLHHKPENELLIGNPTPRLKHP